MPLEIQIQKNLAGQDTGAVTVKLVGSLDTVTAPDLEKQLGPVLGGPVKDMIFDLADLKFISSAGLRVFSSARKTLKERGGQASDAGGVLGGDDDTMPEVVVRECGDDAGIDIRFFEVEHDARDALVRVGPAFGRDRPPARTLASWALEALRRNGRLIAAFGPAFPQRREGHRAPLAAAPAPGLVEEDREGPGAQRRAGLEPRQPPQHREPGVLHDLLGHRARPHEVLRETQQRARVGIDEVCEDGLVTAPQRGDDRCVVPDACGATDGRLHPPSVPGPGWKG